MTFSEWVDMTLYPGFDTGDLTDEELYELEDVFMTYAYEDVEEEEW